MGTQFPTPQKKGHSPPIFGPCLLLPNSCMHQDTTWYAGRPQPIRHCVRWEPSSPSTKGTQPKFLAHVCCRQMVGWTKMPLGMQVGLGPGDFVLDGDPALPPQKGWRAPNFWPMLIVAKRLDGSKWHLAWRWASVQATLWKKGKR